MRGAVITIVVVAAMQVLPAQVGDATVVLRGRVVSDDGSRTTLRGARVAIPGGGAAIAPVFTDGAGTFVVRAPAAARLVVTKAGFAPIVVDGWARQGAPDIEIVMTRGAAISGTVVDEAGFPVHEARVRARLMESAPGAAAPGAVEFTGDTDETGAFRIGSLPAGRYSVHTERQMPVMDTAHAADPGMATRQEELRVALSGRLAPMSEAIVLDAAPGRDTFVALTHGAPAVAPPDAPIGGAASGVVLDEFGDPLEHVTLRLRRIRYSTHRLEAERSTRARESDDRGQFRFFHVPPGRYLLEAVLETPGYAPVYFPGVTTIATAVPVVIGRRQENPGLTITVSRTREARVFGFALDSSGRPLRGQVSLTASARSGAPALPPRTAQPDATGVFEFINVPPGEYVLRATGGGASLPMYTMTRNSAGLAPALQPVGPAPSDKGLAQGLTEPELRANLAAMQQDLQQLETAERRRREYASQFLQVEGTELPPVIIATAPAAILAGRIVLEGDLAGAGPTDFGIVTVPDPDDGPLETISTVPKADGSFELAVSGAFRLSSGNVPRGWWLKSVLVDGTNAVETPIRVSGGRDSRADLVAVFSSEAGSIVGGVRDDRGDPVADYRVVAFSTDRARWFGRSPYVRITGGPEGDGGFTIATVPPGDYYVVALDGIAGDGAAGDWQNPDVLAVLAASASRVSIAAGQRAALSLRLVRWQPGA